MNENEAKTLIERFAEKQQGGHFACPRCGKMTMDAESVTRNALSRRATVYICDACGMQEALEDMMDSITPLTAWAIVAAPDQLIKLAQALNVSMDDLLCAGGKECKMDTGLGKRIYLARTQKKLTQSELGEMVGVSGTAIMRYEKGEREPKILLIRKIAEALGVPVNSLLGVSAQDLRGCAEMPEVSDVAHLSVSVSEIGCLLQNGEITVSTSQQTIHITLSDK